MSDRPRILIADDDESIRRLVARFAEPAGFDVIEACDGEQALALIRSERPDAAVLDIMMPKRDGRDVLSDLRSDAQTRDLPVILFSARDEQSDRLLGLELGADDYIAKPFSPDMLIRRLHALVEKRRRGDY